MCVFCVYVCVRVHVFSFTCMGYYLEHKPYASSSASQDSPDQHLLIVQKYSTSLVDLLPLVVAALPDNSNKQIPQWPIITLHMYVHTLG